MIPMTLAEVAAATGGVLAGGADPGTVVTGPVEFDSRAMVPGGLFLALPGERVDGHDFAAAAVAAGAVAVLATRDVGVPAVVVTDPLPALGRLARAVLDRRPGLAVVGITGSSGKTSTKDLLAQVLAAHGETVAPPGSFNNELGHPYTVLRVTPSTRYLVLEKSARGVGHIAALTDIAPPTIGVVLNVGVAHLGEFGDVDATEKAKGELVEALPADGVAILNADDSRVRRMASRTAARVVLTGQHAEADVRATEVNLDTAGRPSFVLVTAAGSVPVRLALFGEHHVANALAVAAVALELGMTPEQVAAALGSAGVVSRRRMEVVERDDGVILVDDSYNANPDSTAAALRALRAMSGGRRSWAVLGYMAELGPAERDEHDRIGRLVVRLGIDRLVVVGEAARPLHTGAVLEGSFGGESVHVPDQDAAIALLASELRPGDVVLVKGSRYRVWQVADALREGQAGPALREGAE
ncbi:MAG TPA: UDP-N-acetylmuramoyl-tripeptide--D-alanyl-D-alanine ligase [Mycobacteriales bacterium]|nr:UDP-N-acetylmuramoyl-tripeptide--D-alanyl-D-alanine ligase [Mycobacteriales bacterium]